MVLCYKSFLAHLDPTKPTVLRYDASPYGVGVAPCHQLLSGDEVPIIYASRTMSKAETNYSYLDKEALAVMFGVKRFHLYIYGRQVEIHTDHKPLLGLLGETKAIHHTSSPRMQLWARTMMAYSYSLKYIPGRDNAVTNALSRLHNVDNSLKKAPIFEAVNLLQDLQTSPVTSWSVRLWTARDPILSQVKRISQQGWPTSSPPELRPNSLRKKWIESPGQMCFVGSACRYTPTGSSGSPPRLT